MRGTRLLAAAAALTATLSVPVAAQVETTPKKVAILVFPGVETLDFAGPFEAFAADRGHFEVFTVAAGAAAVTAGPAPLSVVPAHTFADCPAPDILVIPGGGTRAVTADSASMAFVKRAAAHAEVVLSVCTGAFVLAQAGLLDGLRATTHPLAIAAFTKRFPGVTVVPDARYVDDGKIITAGGVSAGIDGALHVIARLHGEADADHVAEYLQHARRGDKVAATPGS